MAERKLKVRIDKIFTLAEAAEAHRYVAHHFYMDLKRYLRWVGGAPAAPGATGARGGSHNGPSDQPAGTTRGQ